MGGAIVLHDPESLSLLCSHPEAYQIFQDVGSLVYFEKLQGFDSAITLEFAQNLKGVSSTVCGLCIDITEGAIVEATGLP
jgi:hypothetical protein